MADLTVTKVTNLYLYGQETIPDKLSSARIRDKGVDGATTTVDLSDFMTTGAGRFAAGAKFELVQKFFDTSVIT